VTSAGRAFQTQAPATEKARRPTVGSLTAGTHRSSEVEDRILCRDGMSATGVTCMMVYDVCILTLCPKFHHKNASTDCILALCMTLTHLMSFMPPPLIVSM